MEVGQTIFALNVLSDQFKFAEGNLIILQISQAHFKHTALQPVRGNFCVMERNKTPFINIRSTFFKSDPEFPLESPFLMLSTGDHRASKARNASLWEETF